MGWTMAVHTPTPLLTWTRACTFSCPTQSTLKLVSSKGQAAHDHSMHAQQMVANSVRNEDEISTMRCLVLVASFPVDMIKSVCQFGSAWLMCEDERITTLIILPPSVQTILLSRSLRHTNTHPLPNRIVAWQMLHAINYILNNYTTALIVINQLTISGGDSCHMKPILYWKLSNKIN